MIRLNRTTEYGLMALRHISRKAPGCDRPGGCVCTSAREIADLYGLPFEITAKTLQRLKSAGLIRSIQGARGGYTLRRSLSEISLTEFVELMEGRRSASACEEIRGMMEELNHKVAGFLGSISLAELDGAFGTATVASVITGGEEP